MAPPSFRFQTIELSMRIIQKNAVPDEMQNSVQGFQVRFRSDQIGYLTFINKSIGFSQSLLGVLADGDIIWQKPNITQLVIN